MSLKPFRVIYHSSSKAVVAKRNHSALVVGDNRSYFSLVFRPFGHKLSNS